jgi:hypothetical protein
MPTQPHPRLLAFVRSRVPMVEHDFASVAGEAQAHADQREAIGTYALTQAFFYAAELWVDRPPLVSEQALAYAIRRWGDQAGKIWTLKRAEIPRVDGCRISASGLIYEHVTTGGMFREFVQNMLKERAGTLDAYGVACWLQNNFQTAWVTREEDKELTRQGYKSRRGSTLADARRVYDACRIVIVPRPQDAPTRVLVGDSELIEEVADADPEQVAAAARGDARKYAPFFTAVAGALKQRNAVIRVKHGRDNYYALLGGERVRGVAVVLLLDAHRGAEVRTPVVSLESATSTPGQEPTTQAWTNVKERFYGPEWRLSFGKHGGVGGALCRRKRALAVAFDITDEHARLEAAEDTAQQLIELWRDIEG